MASFYCHAISPQCPKWIDVLSSSDAVGNHCLLFMFLGSVHICLLMYANLTGTMCSLSCVIYAVSPCESLKGHMCTTTDQIRIGLRIIPGRDLQCSSITQQQMRMFTQITTGSCSSLNLFKWNFSMLPHKCASPVRFKMSCSSVPHCFNSYGCSYEDRGCFWLKTEQILLIDRWFNVSHMYTLKGYACQMACLTV